MFSFSTQEKAKILEEITKFNENKSYQDQIKLLHGGGSASLAFIGKKVTVVHPKRPVEEKSIPKALIPTGVLRKKYGVYPISGELGMGTFGISSRKEGINYSNISGMIADKNGIDTTARYATQGKRIFDIKDIHNKIESLILDIDENNYLRTLKMLLMEFTVLMQMDGDGKAKADKYIELLTNEKFNLQKRFSDDADIDRFFNKYLPRLEAISQGVMLPFKTDDDFKNQIYNQFPIIFCSTTEGTMFSRGTAGEVIVNGELSLETVKLVFTSSQRVVELQEKLRELGLNHIEVIGFTLSQMDTEDKNPAYDVFKNTNRLIDMLQTVELYPYLLANEDLVNETIDICLNRYFKDNDEGSLDVVYWLLKNAPSESLINNNSFNKYAALYDTISKKIEADSHYLTITADLINRSEFVRLQTLLKLLPLRKLNTLRMYCETSNLLFDYTQPLSRETLESRFPLTAKTRDILLFCLTLFKEYQKACIEYPRESENRINVIKEIYLQELKQIFKHNHDEPLNQEMAMFINNPLFHSLLPQIKADDGLMKVPAIQTKLKQIQGITHMGIFVSSDPMSVEKEDKMEKKRGFSYKPGKSGI